MSGADRSRLWLLPPWLTAAAVLATLAPSPSAHARSKTPIHEGHYDLDIHGFNDGAPYRLKDAEAEAVLTDPGTELFAFDSPNWMLEEQKGRYVKAVDALGRFPERPPSELVAVYQVDLRGDKTPEMLLIPARPLVSSKRRYAPTILELKDDTYRAVWNASSLRGQRYRVTDIRDLNGDGRPELLLSGESGDSGFYQFTELVARGRRGFATLPVAHVDSLHYVNLDQDDSYEIVVRERVGRRGPAYQWTYVDHLYRWDGVEFSQADEAFPRYHDEQTIPTLLGDLIDHFDAKAAILDEKIDAILTVRAKVLKTRRKPRKSFKKKKIRALRDLKAQRTERALTQLKTLDRAYPYDVAVLLGLAQAHAAVADWGAAQGAASRALSVEPRNRTAWWWLGVAFARLSEHSAAVASFFAVASLSGPRDEGRDFLRARRGEAGMDAALQRAIDQALESLSE